MLIYTSGTSGDPKAVRCTHGKITFPGIAVNSSTNSRRGR
jgi:long-subunit acyl-CoA synthetase (AMP-forming)